MPCGDSFRRKGNAAAILVNLGHSVISCSLGGALDVVVGLLVTLGLRLAGGIDLLLVLFVVLVIRIVQRLDAMATVRTDDMTGKRQERFILLDGMPNEPPLAPGGHFLPLLHCGGLAADKNFLRLELILARLGFGVFVLCQAMGGALHVVMIVQPVLRLFPHLVRRGRGVHNLGLEASSLLLR